MCDVCELCGASSAFYPDKYNVALTFRHVIICNLNINLTTSENIDIWYLVRLNVWRTRPHHKTRMPIHARTRTPDIYISVASRIWCGCLRFAMVSLSVGLGRPWCGEIIAHVHSGKWEGKSGRRRIRLKIKCMHASARNIISFVVYRPFEWMCALLLLLYPSHYRYVLSILIDSIGSNTVVAHNILWIYRGGSVSEIGFVSRTTCTFHVVQRRVHTMYARIGSRDEYLSCSPFISLSHTLTHRGQINMYTCRVLFIHVYFCCRQILSFFLSLPASDDFRIDIRCVWPRFSHLCDVMTFQTKS